MKRLGLDMVTCTSCSPPHQLQRKDLEAHYDAMAAKARGGNDGMFAYSGSSRGPRRGISPKRAQRQAAGGSGLKHSGGRWR